MRLLGLLLVTLCCGCGTTSLLRPVGAGNTRVSTSVGGPFVVLGGAPVPVPVTTMGIAHGVSDAVDIRAGLHPTAAAFGVAGLDVGAAWHPLKTRSLLSLGIDAYGFANGSDAVVLVDPWVGTRARVATWLSLGGGVHVATRAATSSSYQRSLSAALPSVFLQAAVHLGRVTIELEPRWYALGECGSCLAPSYVSPGTGALGLVLGASFDTKETIP